MERVAGSIARCSAIIRCATPVDRARIQDPAYRAERAEAALFTLNWASATGTAILLAAIATALFLRVSLTNSFPWRS